VGTFLPFNDGGWFVVIGRELRNMSANVIIPGEQAERPSARREPGESPRRPIFDTAFPAV
jgi:hypothetical protein